VTYGGRNEGWQRKGGDAGCSEAAKEEGPSRWRSEGEDGEGWWHRGVAYGGGWIGCRLVDRAPAADSETRSECGHGR